MKNPLKITIVMPVADLRGGGEMMLLQLLEAGRSSAVEWRVIYLEAGPMVAQTRDLGIAVRVIPTGQLRQVQSTLRTVREITEDLRRNRPDMVVSWMTKSHLYAGPAAARVGVDALWYALTVPTAKSWMDQLGTIIKAKGILTLCKAGTEGQQQIKPRRPIRLVYPAVDLERFNPALLPSPREMRQRLGLPTEGQIVGIVGRLQRWKGMHTLVEAMPAILREHPDTHCVVVGGEHRFEPEYGAFVESRIRELNLSERVRLVGLQHNINEWVQAMDVFVHASDREPFGIVILEALALGKAVVAGDAGGPTEIITPEINGLLAPYGDSAVLAAQVSRYLSDKGFAEQMGMAGIRRAAEFSINRYVEFFLTAVRELTGRIETSIV